MGILDFIRRRRTRRDIDLLRSMSYLSKRTLTRIPHPYLSLPPLITGYIQLFLPRHFANSPTISSSIARFSGRTQTCAHRRPDTVDSHPVTD